MLCWRHAPMQHNDDDDRCWCSGLPKQADDVFDAEAAASVPPIAPPRCLCSRDDARNAVNGKSMATFLLLVAYWRDEQYGSSTMSSDSDSGSATMTEFIVTLGHLLFYDLRRSLLHGRSTPVFPPISPHLLSPHISIYRHILFPAIFAALSSRHFHQYWYSTFSLVGIGWASASVAHSTFDNNIISRVPSTQHYLALVALDHRWSSSSRNFLRCRSMAWAQWQWRSSWCGSSCWYTVIFL